ncbi:hypothetical protein Tco_1427763 [Tanacetum coccineum]
MARRPLHWKVVQDVNHHKFSNGSVIVVEDDHDVIHDNNSSNLTLFTSLNDLDFAILNIDGQSTDVEAPPDIIVVDDDGDFFDDEDVVPPDLADSDDEVLANDDDDDVAAIMSAGVARGNGGDGGDDDPYPPPPRPIGTNVGGRQATKGGGRDGGNKGVRKETRILRLKKCIDEYGPLKIRFEYNDKGTMLHIDENSARWSNLVGELVREFPMNYSSWHSIEESNRAHIMGRLMVVLDPERRVMWKASDPDLPRAQGRHNGIGRLTFGLTLSMLPKPLKIGQRLRSSTGRDPAHWLFFEISR